MSISEKCAYIKGLAEGLNLDNSKPEARLISELINIVEDLIDVIDDIEEDVEELEEYVEELDHDLGKVESYVFECDDECDCCDCDDEDCDCDCHYEDCADCDGCDEDCECEDCEGCLMEEYYEAQCPNCGEIICFDVDIETEDMVCPACNKHFVEEDDE